MGHRRGLSVVLEGYMGHVGCGGSSLMFSDRWLYRAYGMLQLMYSVM